MSARPGDRPVLGIGFMLVAVFCMSVNDMLIKQLSGGYPLHQMVFVRSAIGIGFSLLFVQLEGGFSILRTRQVGWHALRGLLVVAANMTFFAALAVLPLAEATALVFVSPLFITLLAIPILGERVGLRRFGAVGVGFIGVLVMLWPSLDPDKEGPGVLIWVLPIVAALAYALVQVMTRKLGAVSKASALAVYIQLSFLVVSALFWLVAGDGRFAEGLTDESAIFLLRAWTWPSDEDWKLFALLGFLSAGIGYGLAQAYRSATAATVAPFEYLVMPLAILWGWVVFGEWPGGHAFTGMAIIAGAGLYVFARERIRARTSKG